jgi:hypothetical protein
MGGDSGSIIDEPEPAGAANSEAEQNEFAGGQCHDRAIKKADRVSPVGLLFAWLPS